MEYGKSEYVSVEPQDSLKTDPVILYTDSVSTYASPSLEEVMQDALVASLPYKPKPRLNATESVEAVRPCPSFTSLSNLSISSENSVAFKQKSGRAKVATLLDLIDKFLGVTRFNEFLEFCKDQDESFDGDLMTCLSASQSNESIGRASTFSDDQKQLSEMLNSQPPKNDDDLIANTEHAGQLNDAKQGETIQFDTLKLDDEDYGPDSLAPDCYVRDIKHRDIASLINTPWDFDMLAAVSAHKCTSTAYDKDLETAKFEGWNV